MIPDIFTHEGRAVFHPDQTAMIGALHQRVHAANIPRVSRADYHGARNGLITGDDDLAFARAEFFLSGFYPGC